jgi:tetratricopeptide (TPR) repeat protein
VIRRPLSTLLLPAMLLALPALADVPPPAAPAPPVAGTSLLEQGRAHQAVGSFDEAAGAFETFARQSPAATGASEALQDAVVLRLGMDQADEAGNDAELFVKTYGATQRALAARVSLAVARHLVEHEDYEAARGRLDAWVKAFDADAPLDARLLAHVGLARAHVKRNEPAGAEAEYRLVRDLWHDPQAAMSALGSGDGADRRAAASITAVGEALFFFAELSRREAEKIRFPEYRGPATRKEVLEHMQTKVAAWVKTKHPALDAAEKEYRKVLEIQPVPPPRWVVASASRVGQMWGKFVAELRAAPIPREWKGQGPVPGTSITYDALRADYYRALDDASEPMKRTARSAFKTCADYSVKYQYVDAYARRCTEWLAKNDGTGIHPLDELRPRWGQLGPGISYPQPLPDPR